MANTKHLIYFSPTKTTKRVVEAIANGIDSTQTKIYNLTLPKSDHNETLKIDNGMAIFGVPVYAGRIPKDAIHRLKSFRGTNTPAVIVVVYGNREYEDALVELRDLVTELGFRPFAAAAFIGEHSYSTPEKPIAQNRPDANDLQLANTFGKEIGKIVAKSHTIESLQNIPGNTPYKLVQARPPMSPITLENECTKCGICVAVCPTQAIKMNNTIETDQTTCIMCCACIKQCPTLARVNNNETIKTIAQRLFENCSARKEPEIFFN